MSSLFAAFLGVNPVAHLLALDATPWPRCRRPTGDVLTGHEFFPQLISGPFHDGLVVVFIVAAGLSVLAALASLLRGGRYVPAPASIPRHQGSRPMTDAPTPIDPRRTALLVMDYQQAIVGMIEDSDALVARAVEAIDLVRAPRRPRRLRPRRLHRRRPSDIPPTSRMGARIAAGPQAFHADSPTTQIDERVAPQDGDIIVRKTRVGAFSTTDLAQQLRRPRDRHPHPRRHQHERRRPLHGARRL